jgi:hypothetical protein
MRHIQFRFTVRGLMVAIAAAGVLLFSYQIVVDFFLMLRNHDANFSSTKKYASKHWDLGTSPSVAVDLFDGWIVIVPSRNIEVVADVEIGVSNKSSQAAADKALMAIDSRFHQWKDTLKISLTGMKNHTLNYSNIIKLYVPSGTHLDLRTGRGNIHVGRDYLNGKWVHTPISASSIRARNDSEYALGKMFGSVVVEALARPGTQAKPSYPTLIQIDAPGRIDIIADAAVVEANAWHGNPPKQWPQGVYESEDEGTISFEGSLARGIHSLRAAHRINMKLQKTDYLRIDAEATSGQIAGNLLREQIEPMEGKACWFGSLGAEEGGIIQLRTSDGSIELHK